MSVLRYFKSLRVLLLIYWLTWWLIRDAIAENIYQQIVAALSFIGYVIWFAVFLWIIDEYKSDNDIKVNTENPNN